MVTPLVFRQGAAEVAFLVVLAVWAGWFRGCGEAARWVAVAEFDAPVSYPALCYSAGFGDRESQMSAQRAPASP